MKKVPTSKAFIALVLIAGVLYLAWVCWEMHRLGDISGLPEITKSVMALVGAALAFYVWRAKKSDDYALALKKAKDEKRLGVEIKTDPTIETETIEEEEPQG